MHKIKKVLLFLFLLIPVFILTACPNNHTHTYEDKWTYDSVGHWHKATCEHDVTSGFEQHTFGAWITVTNPTEDAEGLAERKCNICDYKETKKLDKLPHTHKFSSDWSSDDLHHWHASTCGHDVTTPKEEHSYGDWTITVNPTEDTEGSKERVCSVCNHKQIEKVDKLAHTHTFASTYSSDKNYHWYASTCNHPETEIKEVHEFSSWTVTKEATESEEGSKERTCLVCGYKDTRVIDKIAHTHTFASTWTYDEDGHWHQATCEHTDILGSYASHVYTEGSNTCSICGYEKQGDVVVDDNYSVLFNWNSDYEEVNIVVKNATTNEEVKNINLAPTKVTVNPTCTEKGKTTYSISFTYKGIDYTDTKEKEIEELGHSYIFSSFNWDNDHNVKVIFVCENDNTHTKVDDVSSSYITVTYSEDNDGKCLKTYTVNYLDHTDSDIAEVEHEYGAWTTTKEATETEEGTKERTCANCGHKDIESIPVVVIVESDDLTKSGIYTGDYYNSITASMLSNAETLRTALTELINENYTRFSYSGESGTVGKLKIVDSYDLDYIECIYTGQRIEKANAGSNSGAWNKEHVWAKSHGFNDEKYDAYSDMHHLRVSEANINSTRSNYPFAEIPENYKSSTNYGYDEYGNKWYKSGNDSIFEPRDEVKGDIARMLLYMTIKYNGTYSKDGLNLVLRLSDNKSDIWSETNTGDGNYGGLHYLGMLSTLIKWHYQDPVDEREIYRNNQIYALQHNRNPFIDHPEYVYYLHTNESSSYITEANLSSLNNYTASNATAIAALESIVDALPNTITIVNEAEVEDAVSKYEALGQVSKSFFKKYRKLMDLKQQLDILLSAASQDTTISTTISFKNLSNTTGSVVNNGITVSYVASGNNADFGIYAQGTSQGTKPATLTVNGGYANIKKIIFSLTTNKSGGTTADITITDGKNTVTVNSQAVTYTTSKTTVSTITVDVTLLDLTKPITITVKNNSSSSVRIKDITFSIS